MNTIIITGNLTKDPTTKKTNSDKLVVSSTLAVNRPYTKDQSDFFDFEVWGTQADYVARYGHKGDRAEIIGSMESFEYEKKDGGKVFGWKVKVSNINIYASKGEKKSDKPNESAEDMPDDLPF